MSPLTEAADVISGASVRAPRQTEHDVGPSDVLAAHRRRRRRLRLLRLCLGLGAPLAALGVWEWLALTGEISAIFFPAPSRVAVDMWSLVTSQGGLKLLGSDIGVTMSKTGIALGIGSLLGIVLGIAMGLSRRTWAAFGPLVFGTYPTPKVILYPVALGIFGLGPSSTVALATLGVFYVLCLSTASGVTAIPRVHHDVAAVFAMPRSQRYLRIVLPAAWPSVIAGLKLAIGEGLVLVLSVEFISSSSFTNGGVGAYIWNAWQQLAVGQMFVGLVVICLIGGLLVALGNIVEHWTVPWRND